MSRLLVTGSSGLVGSGLVRTLSDAGHEVVPFDLNAAPPRDLRDPQAIAAAIDGCDGVYHLAAISRVAWGEEHPALCDEINVTGTRLLLDAAAAAPTRPWVVFASSREIYGNPAGFPVRESDAPAPVNGYGRSKLAGEELMAAAREAGLRTAIVRLSNVYGTENDHPDRAVPALLWRAMTGQDLTLTGEDVFFDFVHVDDCVRGLVLAADAVAAGRALPPLHLVSGIRSSLGDVARLAVETTGSDSKITILPPRAFDVAGFVGDPALAQQLLGFRVRTELGEGMAGLRDRLAARGRPMDPVTVPLGKPSFP